jgi:hypothetical protein
LRNALTLTVAPFSTLGLCLIFKFNQPIVKCFDFRIFIIIPNPSRRFSTHDQLQPLDDAAQCLQHGTFLRSVSPLVLEHLLLGDLR